MCGGAPTSSCGSPGLAERPRLGAPGRKTRQVPGRCVKPWITVKTGAVSSRPVAPESGTASRRTGRRYAGLPGKLPPDERSFGL
ncbi:hypothetical protein GDO86_006984 [Hymenochirus boettgeri]|uniref:Uncharacterized protein n=1 Tax=Hymenochirus boettgeri TaxID=247094 RepID=A0A8T2JD09_9PIPI|nr:hypothetical protein GDO86_006984 [Hymenochirus boettgeri]